MLAGMVFVDVVAAPSFFRSRSILPFGFYPRITWRKRLSRLWWSFKYLDVSLAIRDME